MSSKLAVIESGASSVSNGNPTVTSSVPTRVSARFKFVIIWISLGACVVSLLGSWIPSFWGDEAASIMSAQRPLPSLFRMLGVVDAVHGTYYFGLHWWIAMFGASPFSVRFPSSVAVGLMVAGVMVIGQRLDNQRLAVVAGIICAVLPRTAYMGIEARSYAFGAAIATWLIVVLIELIRAPRPRARWWVAYGVLLALGIYVFLYIALFVIVHGIVLVASRVDRRTLGKWALTCMLAILAAVPVVVTAYQQRGQIAFLGNRDIITIRNVLIKPWFGIYPIAGIAWTLIGIAVLTVTTRRGVVVRGKHHLRLDVVAAAWLGVPLCILVAIFPFMPIFTPRYASFSTPAAALLIALAIDWFASQRRWALILLTSIVVAAMVPMFVWERTPNAKNNSDWSQIAAYMGQHARPGEGILFDDSVRKSRRTRLAMRTYPKAFTGLDDITIRVPYVDNTQWYDSAYTPKQAAHLGRFAGLHRVWVIDYEKPGVIKRYGQGTLHRLGYVPIAVEHLHRSMITEFELQTSTK